MRYGDTDRQGHINNAAYCTFFESGRVAFLCHERGTIADDGFSFVIAKLSLDFLKEMNFPGVVDVGTRINHIGKSSFICGQALFKNDECCSTAESVIVLTDNTTRRSSPLPEKVLAALRQLQ
ncbi:MAG: acyl-CoA thioesterase [Candidatus Melainabacteria bacterium]|nr:acyl-CoA thioesterase [Candidatus Melainabacteria bacterium]